MSRPLRYDQPGVLFHVMNRSTMQRPLFLGRGAFRFFLSLLVGQVRAGRVAVYVYCLMDTHFHLILRSVCGELSRAFQQIESRYASAFNRHHDRFGPLFGGRFLALPIEDAAHLLNAVGYVDMNPVAAGICTDPVAYPFSSAKCLATGTAVPSWLDRSLVDEVLERPRAGPARIEEYVRLFHSRREDGASRVIEAGLHGGHAASAQLSGVLWGTDASRLAWLEKRAQDVDGRTRFRPLVDPSSVIASAATIGRGLSLVGTEQDAVQVASTAVMRDFAGMTFHAIASSLYVSRSTAWRLYDVHRRQLADNLPYQALVLGLAAHSLRVCYGDSISREHAHRLASSGLLSDARPIVTGGLA